MIENWEIKIKFGQTRSYPPGVIGQTRSYPRGDSVKLGHTPGVQCHKVDSHVQRSFVPIGEVGM